ncbi:hypothetical protein ACTXT7_005190 [Hymenolepis weldensis]
MYTDDEKGPSKEYKKEMTRQKLEKKNSEQIEDLKLDESYQLRADAIPTVTGDAKKVSQKCTRKELRQFIRRQSDKKFHHKQHKDTKSVLRSSKLSPFNCY